jgi:hypothetical protein
MAAQTPAAKTREKTRSLKELLDLLPTKSVLTNLFPYYPQNLWVNLWITWPSGSHTAVTIASDTDWWISDHIPQVIETYRDYGSSSGFPKPCWGTRRRSIGPMAGLL